ncbi:alpha/beta hydrolase [Pseudomonas turukhanskensis]|uniref:Alpha/beta hydrolase n=1 Tax=Pseudomonas turukhanskensis TaxID=1806536 RepID=A0A9W6K901_9PSED|nr:alpha/beta hydrolase [Pseudomonas turukhanskensis]GLK91132.1 alpha/beta hydrolase [Pseudomonas turukhanskensis]
MTEAIALDQVAADAVALVRAFRANGAVSFQDVPLADARASYLKACAANGVAAQDVAAVRTLEFPVADGTANVRVYRPLGSHPDSVTPLVVFIHGGGWVIGNLDSHDSLCRSLANQSGASVVAVDYRLAPEHRFPLPLDDCLAAIHFIRDNALDLQVDLNNAVIAGDSAGGNMATVLANHPEYQVDGLRFTAQVLFYPVTDLTASHRSYQRFTEGFALTAASMYWFREQYVVPGQDLSDARLSPLLHAEGRTQPDLFILTVGHDPLADEGIAYAAAAAGAGTVVMHHHLPRHAHGVLTSAGKIETGRTLLTQAAHFIASRFTAPR